MVRLWRTSRPGQLRASPGDTKMLLEVRDCCRQLLFLGLLVVYTPNQISDVIHRFYPFLLIIVGLLRKYLISEPTINYRRTWWQIGYKAVNGV